MTVMTLKSAALVVHPVHVVLLNRPLVYGRWLVENRMTSMGFFPAKMETCEKSELSGEGRGKWTHYWLIGT